ncbi:hypothetical protein IJH26_00515 [Candidatus Saccharibacteria bacterium]|nr:hypothetical protein [Candidatus Saccharibacteria bacterium]
MRIKILVLSLVATILTVTMSSTTMSYLIDMEVSDAVFTVGNVKVLSVSEHSGVCENMQKNDTCINSLAVKNTGVSDAYVRVRVLVPEDLLSEDSPTLEITTANDEFVESENSIYCNGTDGDLCKEYVSRWDDRLISDTTAAAREISFKYLLDASVSVEGEGNEGESINPAILGIKVYTEAIQAQGFMSAEDAFANF